MAEGGERRGAGTQQSISASAGANMADAIASTREVDGGKQRSAKRCRAGSPPEVRTKQGRSGASLAVAEVEAVAKAAANEVSLQPNPGRLTSASSYAGSP